AATPRVRRRRDTAARGITYGARRTDNPPSLGALPGRELLASQWGAGGRVEDAAALERRRRPARRQTERPLDRGHAVVVDDRLDRVGVPRRRAAAPCLERRPCGCECGLRLGETLRVGGHALGGRLCCALQLGRGLLAGRPELAVETP